MTTKEIIALMAIVAVITVVFVIVFGWVADTWKKR
jgi:hypothetical protein